MTKDINKILLVYPEIPKNTYWSYHFALNFINKKSAMPPLGLITVASLLSDQFDFRLVDMNIEPLSDECVQWADLIMVSVMIVQKPSFQQVLDVAKRLGKPVMAGGPYVTSSQKEMENADHLVLGEMEGMAQEIGADIASGELKKTYQSKGMPDISQPSIPRFDLLNWKAYGSMSVQYSRGCPFQCEFCDIWKVYGNRPRLKSTDAFLAELDALYALGYRGGVFLVDDNFIGNKKRVRTELLPGLISWQKERGFPFSFFTEASINLADDESLLDLMKEARFNQVFIGIETPEKASLEETGKTQNLKNDLLESVKRIQKKGIEVMAGFIVGFDSDPEDVFDRQLTFIQEAAIPQAMVGLLTALPGTDLYHRLEREKRILFLPDGNNTHHLSTNFKTVMDEEILRKGYRRLLSELYGKGLTNYFKRCETLMSRLGERTLFQRNITHKEIWMLVKSLCRQPFTAYGWRYLRFIFKNLFLQPDIFGEVVRYAIIGHHFHTITREMIKVDQVVSDLDAAYGSLTKYLNRYSDVLIGHSRESLQGLYDRWNKESRILKKILRKIGKLHVDFRNDATWVYVDTLWKMHSLFSAFLNRAKGREDILPAP